MLDNLVDFDHMLHLYRYSYRMHFISNFSQLQIKQFIA